MTSSATMSAFLDGQAYSLSLSLSLSLSRSLSHARALSLYSLSLSCHSAHPRIPRPFTHIHPPFRLTPSHPT